MARMNFTNCCRPASSSENTSTMLRLDWLSASLNTYFPGMSTLPGIFTGSFTCSRVSLFHSSAIAGAIVELAATKTVLNHHTLDLVFIFLYSFLHGLAQPAK